MSPVNNNVTRTALDTIRRHKLISLGILLAVGVSVGVSLIPPLVLEKIIDRLGAGEGVGFGMALAYFALTALSGLAGSAQEALLTVFGQKMTHAMRSGLSEKLCKLPASELLSLEPGAVASRFIGDVDTVEALFTSGVVSMFADACRVISIFAVIAVRNIGLALLLIVILPVVFLFTRFVQKKMLASQLENRVAVAGVSGHVPETMRNIRTIHTLGKEKYMEDLYDERIDRSYRAVEKTNFCDAVYSPVITILNAATVGIVMLLSASGNASVLSFFGMSVGASVAVMNYIAGIFTPIESLGMEIQTIQSALAGAKRIDEFLNLPERKIPEHSADISPRPDISLDDVHFGYEDGKEILHGVSFRVSAGDQVTLAGRTGAGKSTIFRLILGLFDPWKGDVTVGGVSAREIPDETKRQIFGYVEQTFRPVPGTVLDQLTLGDPAVTKEMAIRAAKTVGLSETIESFPDGCDTPYRDEMFSQGERQLLSVARAISAGPPVLLLDEMTADLDADTERMVLEAIRAASEGRTVLSISHRVYASLGGKMIRV